MATLYTLGQTVSLTPAEFLSYTAIQASATDAVSAVSLGFTVSGTVDFQPRLGTRAAEIFGFAGNDWIQGGSGADSIRGEGGDDALFGGLGNDILAGDDKDFVLSGRDTLYGGADADALIGGLGDDLLYGGDGDDIFVLTGEAPGNDSFFGGAGNDTVLLTRIGTQSSNQMHVQTLNLSAATSVEYLVVDSGGPSQLLGTLGNDVFDLSGVRGIVIFPGNGQQAWGNFDLLTGQDRLTGTAGYDRVWVQDGNDVLALGAGDDEVILADGEMAGSRLDGGAGNDTLTIGSELGARVSLLTASAYSSFEYIAFGNQIGGTAGNDLWDLSGVDLQTGLPREVDLGGGQDQVTMNATYGFGVHGGAGNDSLWGRDRADTLYGDAGNDLLDGGLGLDRLSGGLGVDQIYGGLGDDIMRVTDWNGDTIQGGAGTDLFIIGELVPVGAPVVTVAVNMVLTTASGFEKLFVDPGARLLGTAGANRFDFFGLAEYRNTGLVRLLEGNDYFRSGATANADSVDGGAGNDTLIGGFGDDVLLGGAGIDLMVGGVGSDVYGVDNQADITQELPSFGTDAILTSLTFFQIRPEIEVLQASGSAGLHGVGSARGEKLIGAAGADVLEGLAGNDTLVSSAGLLDKLVGGLGDDLYEMDAGPAQVIELAGGGNDTIVVGTGTGWAAPNVELLLGATTGTFHGIGTAGGDRIQGVNFDCTLEGMGGNDTLISSARFSTLIGGAGDDTYILTNADSQVIETADGGYDRMTNTTSNGGIVMGDNVEEAQLVARLLVGKTITAYTGGGVRGSATDNLILGSIGDDHLFGGAGNDTLQGNGADVRLRRQGDVLDGGAGNDLLILSAADQTVTLMDGGLGDDVFDLRAMDLSLVATMVGVADQGEGQDRILIRGGGTFALTRYSGLIETVQVFSQAGEATWLTGSNRGDILLGGDGAEVFEGMNGLDRFTGGGGADTFVLRWRPLLQNGEPAVTPDVITDFTHGEDKIAVSPGLARPPQTPLAALSAAAFKDLALGTVDGDDRYLYDQSTGSLYYDPDGKWLQPAILIATIENHATLTAADFLVF